MTSSKTVDACVDLLLEYFSTDKATEFCRRLSRLDGNKSFRDSVATMHGVVAARAGICVTCGEKHSLDHDCLEDEHGNV